MVQGVFQFLLDDVADHTFCFSAQYIQRISLVRLIGGALKRQ